MPLTKAQPRGRGGDGSGGRGGRGRGSRGDLGEAAATSAHRGKGMIQLPRLTLIKQLMTNWAKG